MANTAAVIAKHWIPLACTMSTTRYSIMQLKRKALSSAMESFTLYTGTLPLGDTGPWNVVPGTST